MAPLSRPSIEDKEQVSLAIKRIDGTPDGALIIDYILNFCHVLEGSFVPNEGADVFMFNEGQRSVGNEIVSLLGNDSYVFKRKIINRLKTMESTD